MGWSTGSTTSQPSRRATSSGGTRTGGDRSVFRELSPDRGAPEVPPLLRRYAQGRVPGRRRADARPVVGRGRDLATSHAHLPPPGGWPPPRLRRDREVPA